MLGAIAGDIIGSYYEVHRIKTKDFKLFLAESTFTDDTVLSVAVAEHILTGRDIVDLFHEYTAMYPLARYGAAFFRWAITKSREPYHSYGNGAAMRISPVGFAFDEWDRVLEIARAITVVTHDHKEAIRGAQATAAAIFLARKGYDKEEIRESIEANFGYDLRRSVEDIRPNYRFDVSCQGSVPESIISFLDSKDFVDAIRNAISLGGDADTMACIAGGIAQAYYGGVPPFIKKKVMQILDGRLKSIVIKFSKRFNCWE